MKHARSPLPPPADAPPSPPRIEQLVALTFVLSARLSAAEHAIAELRTAAGLAPLALPAIETSTPWCSIKEAAFRTGFSQSYVRKLIAADKVRSQRCGGRVLVDADTIPVRR
jgi:excisionase family DNA binding protein